MTTPAFDDIPETALAWHREGRGAALATVIETWGSAPRPVGSQLAISGDGAIAGSVSGGCVEGAVVVEAADMIAAGAREAKLLEFGVSDDEAFAVGLACGGRIAVLVEPIGSTLPDSLLSDLVEARAARRPTAYLVDAEAGQRRLAGSDEEGLPARFRADRSGFLEDGRTFAGIHNPPLRMVVVGAVHIAQPLVVMARLAGYAPELIDPREAFGSAERFPGEALSHDYPDEVLARVPPDARTAIVTLSHDPKIDDPAILAALRSDCFYLGCLGSTRTHAKRLDRLRPEVGEEALARIHAPVGLDIGSRSPAEIAISIMAEVTGALRQGD
ncbi:XdhC family protein [Roseicyclus sp. F158]|uniref:XdhC family protein n=1 Tax=Tropicimonas omnivorans TaxID=3075590 RepID=A0ABU3DG79_9RHOB|nr:XdhC family protein [Roseicyclus sp. F158]MDT0682720.1 XdhC family protein [Roseicyclus sp. F158]